MKKKILGFALAASMVVAGAFTLTACGESSQELTAAEKAVVYKEAAISTWEKMGVSDPTIETKTAALLSLIPDKKQETANKNDILQIKMNANNMASVLYLVGSLYENSNFVMTDGYAKFSVSATIFDYTNEYEFTLKPELDIKNNKLYLAACITVGTVSSQYIVVDANYNFETKDLISFRLYTNTVGMYIDIEMGENGENKYYATMDGEDSFAVAVNAEKASFLSASESIAQLSYDFSAEYQAYMTLSQKVIEELGG